WLDLCQAMVEELQTLPEACEPATFGLGQRDVFDKYLKAGKMDKNNFSTNLDVAHLGIVDRLREQLIEGEDEENYSKAELHQENYTFTLITWGVL
ncbi:hypothetical protein H0H81_007202, partial [Sphagnurus paluster]